MLSGAHLVLYSKDAAADRAFFRDIFGCASVDAGHGWLIFALPPAEAAFHPAEGPSQHELYFMCADLPSEMRALAEKGRLVRLLKGRSSRLLRQEFPTLKSRLPTLWTNSYFVSDGRWRSLGHHQAVH